MTSTSQRIRALSPAQFEQLRTKNDDEFGQGYPLWEELVKQSNRIRNSGRDIIANDRFRMLLLNAKTKYETECTPLAECSPTYEAYRSLIDEYNGAPSRRGATSASQPAVVTRTETAVPGPVAQKLAEETRTPAPAPAPVASPTPDVTVHRTTEPAPQPAPVVERDDTQAPAWFSSWNEQELRPTLANAVQDHNILHGENDEPGLIAKVDDIDLRLKKVEEVLPRHENGHFLHHSEWFDRTVNHEVTVAGRKFKWVPAVVAFIVALLLAMTFNSPTWWGNGFWYSITWGKTLFAGLVAIVVLILTNLNSLKSASAA